MNSTVMVNNNLLTYHPYGYTSFHCDLTPYLLYGQDNIISVIVNNNQPNSRWYSGSGIYRHVWMLVFDEVHIAPWGIFVTTPEVSKDSSVVSVKTEIINDGDYPKNVSLQSRLIDANGKETCNNTKNVQVSSRDSIEVYQSMKVVSPFLWSVEEPYLYILESKLMIDNKVVDSRETTVGIRSISFDTENGFQLNGVSMKLKGGCVHHDCGLLGAASFDRAEERKVELLKASGYNAVRCAHNPPAPAFLDACDRLGMLVIDEAFDCWRVSKTPNDYSMFFEDWWEKDMRSMIFRDRNHPSIIMWSTGNEIKERTGMSKGAEYSKKLTDYVRKLDSTRAVTNSLQNIVGKYINNDILLNMTEDTGEIDYFGKLSYEFVQPMDVVGYNYLLHRYESDGKKFPNRIICGTESFPKDIFDYWSAVEKLPYVIGDFVWAGIDYLGEAGVGNGWPYLYPWSQAYCGDIDICGFKRPQSYYRDCVWGGSIKPYIVVHNPEKHGKVQNIPRWGYYNVIPSWTWPGWENKPTVVDIYSTDTEVELMLNNQSLGRKPAGKENRYTASFEVNYNPGELTAIGYRNGEETSRTVLKTAGAPSALKLTPDRNKIHAKQGDLSYVTVELVDKDGNIVPNAFNTVFFTVSGEGTLQAVGNSNPASEEMYV